MVMAGDRQVVLGVGSAAVGGESEVEGVESW